MAPGTPAYVFETTCGAARRTRRPRGGTSDAITPIAAIDVAGSGTSTHGHRPLIINTALLLDKDQNTEEHAMAVDFRPLPYTIAVADVAGSGVLDDYQQLRMRASLQAVFGEALGRLNIDPDALDIQDLGDGIRLIVNATVSPKLMLDPFIPYLADALCQHHRKCPDATLRLRTVVHMGLLHRDRMGWAGAPLVHCARLLNATSVRRIFVETEDCHMILIASQIMYDAIIRHGFGLDKNAYRAVRISAKETTTVAWIYLPGHSTPPI